MFLNITTAFCANNYKDCIINENDKLGTVTIERSATLKFSSQYKVTIFTNKNEEFESRDHAYISDGPSPKLVWTELNNEDFNLPEIKCIMFTDAS